MKIALIGYGKMGKAIEEVALEKGHEIVLKIDVQNNEDFTKENLQKADVAIEFTGPHSAYENVKKCIQSGVPVVSGSTGWLEKWNEISALCDTNNGSLVYSSNYSIGVNLFWKITQTAAKLISNYDYQVHIDEIHHTQKLDAPSGTAITTAELILQEMRSLSSWTNEIVTKDQLNSRNNSSNSELLIRSVREEQVPGTHTVSFENEIDQISVSHIAHNRKGFAAGAIQAAKFIINKKGIFNMNDLLSL